MESSKFYSCFFQKRVIECNYQKEVFEMKRKGITALILATAMIVTSLTGCGGKKTDVLDVNSSESQETQKSESENDVNKEKIVVNIWSGTFDAENELAAFQKAYSESELSQRIEVNFTEVPAGTNQEKADALLINLIGDSEIDIFDANLSEYFNFASKGLFENLEPYAQADGFDISKLGQDNVELSKINGNMYALPYIQSVWQLYYNKDLFDAAGIAYPTDNMTWDEFRELALKLTKGDGADKQWGFTMPDWVCTWATIASQHDINFIKDDGTSNLDNPKFREALQFKYDLTMVDKSGPSLAENTVTKAHYAKQFSAGNVAMMIAGDWVHESIRTNLEGNYTFQYDVAAIPHPEGVEAGTTYGAPRYIGINAKRSEEQKSAAWEVLEFMSGPEVAKILVEEAGTLPAVVTDEIKDVYVGKLPEFVTNGAVIFNEHKHVEEKPYHMASGQIDSVMNEEAQLYLTDSQDLDKTIENMIRRSNEEIKIVVESLK